jgi:hypothetical protein
MSEHSRPYVIHSDEECERRKRVETLPFTGRRRFPWSVDAPADDARAQAVRDAERSNKLTALGQKMAGEGAELIARLAGGRLRVIIDLSSALLPSPLCLQSLPNCCVTANVETGQERKSVRARKGACKIPLPPAP